MLVVSLVSEESCPDPQGQVDLSKEMDFDNFEEYLDFNTSIGLFQKAYKVSTVPLPENEFYGARAP